jgi:ferrous iron transport protein B
MVLWLLARPRADGVSMLAAMSGALDPLGRLLGMDGMILCAFLLGFPANETVLPILLMGYLAEGALPSAVSLAAVRDILLAHGWTPWTAVCVMLFSLMHWPCSTTLWTIRRETGSFGQTVLAFFLPTACGVLACAAVHGLSLLLSAL